MESESGAVYIKKTIKFFSTFEEMENDRLKYYANLLPEELFKNLKQLSTTAFGFRTESAFRTPDRKIKFE